MTGWSSRTVAVSVASPEYRHQRPRMVETRPRSFVVDPGCWRALINQYRYERFWGESPAALRRMVFFALHAADPQASARLPAGQGPIPFPVPTPPPPDPPLPPAARSIAINDVPDRRSPYDRHQNIVSITTSKWVAADAEGDLFGEAVRSC
jgi:transglutaminase-like putative cysteine protease